MTENKMKTDVKEYINIWNEMAERCGLPAVRILNKQRVKKLKERLEEAKQIGEPMAIWQEAVDRIEVSPWCNGDNPRQWKASIDYLLQESSFAKVLEGALGGDIEGLEKKRADAQYEHDLARVRKTRPEDRTQADWQIRFKKARSLSIMLEHWSEELDGRKPKDITELKLMMGIGEKLKVVS